MCYDKKIEKKDIVCADSKKEDIFLAYRGISDSEWDSISFHNKLSEELIREFKDKVNWYYLAKCHKFSKELMRDLGDEVEWDVMCCYQQLSEDFIREFKDKVNWVNISVYQQLSEDFIREFQDKVNWTYISWYQILSEKFIEEFKDKIYEENIEIRNEINRKTTTEKKILEMKEYAEKHNLKFDGEYLYAFRNHDKHGRGAFNKTLTYSKGNYYRDWHCDMREGIKNSFGLGIWPEGNTPVRVKVEDWGVCVDREDGKCRVWGFEVI